MNDTEKTAIKLMVYAQSFVDTLDQFKGTNAYRQRLKQKAKAFNSELEKFLNAAYCGGQTDSNVIELLDKCQQKVDEIFDNDVEVV